MEADAIATACMAGTLEEAQELLDLAGVEGMLIIQDSIWETAGFKRFISEVSVPGRTVRN